MTELDLDDLERKAKAAMHSRTARYFVHPEDGAREVVSWSPTIDGRDTCVPQGYADTFRAVDAVHIAANSPPVTLALIARIRMLKRTVEQAAALLEAGSDKAARREWALKSREYVADDSIAGEVDRLDAIAMAATAFVDEQGKRADVDRGYTIGLPEDFAATEFEALVRAVEGAGR